MQATTTAPLFAALLKPDRSLRLTGGWVAYVIALAMAIPLAVLAPDALLSIAAAFAIVAVGLTGLTIRQGRQARMKQQVTLWVDQLEIATIDHTGARALLRFDPKQVRLVLDRDENEKTLRMRLKCNQDECDIGLFLKPEDRASFARAFGTALRRARQAA
jgi:uncharacterized membrane protein